MRAKIFTLRFFKFSISFLMLLISSKISILPGLAIVNVSVVTTPITPIFTPLISYTIDFSTSIPFNAGSSFVSRFVPKTVTLAFFILLRKGSRPSGPSSNSWFPRHTASYIMFSIASATMLYFRTVYQTVP
uniref:Uncharacterized protein n=1 Tax=Ixodes ricinus TaxID=34613 RepID=A0A6B0UQX8_IXORI